MISSRRKIAACVAAVICVCFLIRPAHAFGDQLLLAQSGDGRIFAKLNGMLYPCTFVFGGTSFSRPAADEILVETQIYDLQCPIHKDDTPSPYSLPVQLGLLPDGDYNISWIFVGSGISREVASARFTIKAGVLSGLPVAIPTVTEWGMVLFMIIAGFGCVYYLRTLSKTRCRIL